MIEIKDGFRFVVSSKKHLGNWNDDMDRFKGEILEVFGKGGSSEYLTLYTRTNCWSWCDYNDHIDWIKTCEINNVPHEQSEYHKKIIAMFNSNDNLKDKVYLLNQKLKPQYIDGKWYL